MERPGLLRRALTWHLLSGLPPAGLASSTLRRIAADPAWSAYYDLLRRIERAASGAELGPGQIDALESMILAGVRREERASTPALARTTSLAFVGALSALFAFSSLDAPPPAPAPLVERSVGAGELRREGVRVRCVAPGAPRVLGDAAAGPREPFSSLRCPPGALLAFSLTNIDGPAAYVFVLGVSQGGDLRWYAPFDEDGASFPAPPGTIDRALEVVADTAGMPRDERVTLHLLFSDEPLDGRRLARIVRGAQTRGVPLGALERLPIEGVRQARIELVSPAEAAP